MAQPGWRACLGCSLNDPSPFRLILRTIRPAVTTKFSSGKRGNTSAELTLGVPRSNADRLPANAGVCWMSLERIKKILGKNSWTLAGGSIYNDGWAIATRFDLAQTFNAVSYCRFFSVSPMYPAFKFVLAFIALLLIGMRTCVPRGARCALQNTSKNN